MADPKYANLPGIASDQPDCYESTGLALPEADQDWANQDSTSDAIETLHVTANEAFGKFKGKVLAGEKVDFSDELKSTKYRKGYISWSGDYEVVNRADLNETPVQKYQRLNCEVRELIEELEEAKKSDKGEAADGKESLVNVANKVMGLQEDLTSLNLEERLGSDMLKSLQDPRGAANARLLAHLEKLNGSGSAGAKTASSAGGSKDEDGSGVTYELLMKPNTARMEQMERISQFDKRLEFIEKTLGVAPESLNALSAETNQKDVLGAIQVLSSRTALLDAGHLDHVEGRLAALQQKMNALAEKKQILEDQEKQAKINELYELAQRSDAHSSVLADVVDRLDGLQGLHGQALQFSKALAQLESVQEKLDTTIAANQSLLKGTGAEFATNLANIQENFKSLEGRVAKLGK